VSEIPVSTVKTLVEHKHTRGDWLNPLNRIIWQTAFKAKATQMTLRDGRKFNLTYEDRSGILKVWVQIDRNSAYVGHSAFLPCGWFDYDTVVSKEWITSGS